MSDGTLSVLAVDDERTPLGDLARLLGGSPQVGGVDTACAGHEALAKLAAEHYDAVFLDVRMPDLDGLELGRVLRRFTTPPQIVFVTAYDSAAVEAFELRAIDYLLKPVSRRRLEESLERVAAAVVAADQGGPDTGDVVAVATPSGGAIRLLHRDAILFVQSHGDFVRVVAPEGRFLLRETLAEIERRWAPQGFVRVHRQYVANLRQATELRPQLGGTAELGFAGGHTIPVARRHVGELQQRLSP